MNNMSMSYEEYEKNRQEIINVAMNNTYFTKEYFEKLQEKYKRLNEFETKIDNLAKEYFNIIQDNLPEESIKDINFAQYGYYEILEYCLKQIKMNDKNLMTGFAAGLTKKAGDE